MSRRDPVKEGPPGEGDQTDISGREIRLTSVKDKAQHNVSFQKDVINTDTVLKAPPTNLGDWIKVIELCSPLHQDLV